MKKLALVILAAVSFATANAQFAFGVKGGFNFNNITGSDVGDTKVLFDFNAGVYARLGLADRLSFQPELVYSSEGARFNDADGYKETNHYNYLNIPLLLSYNLVAGLHVETGPQIGFLTSAHDHLTTPNQSISTDISNDIKSANFSWVFGLNYRVPATPVGVDFRYNLGISNIEDNDATGSNGSIRTSTFQLGVTYTLFKTGR